VHQFLFLHFICLIYLTVILHVTFLPLPSAAVQVIVAVPAFLAVTFPLEDTVATLVLLDFQVTVLSVIAFL
jgi:hypothetical protein